jgi:hypothetical protein
MDRITDRIVALHPSAIPDIDFLLYQPPDDELQIHNWNEEKLGPVPTWIALAALKLEPLPSAPPRLSFLEFMDLFTDTEQHAIAGAAMTDVTAKLWYDRAVGAQYIDLTDARLAVGLQMLVDAGLITGARRSNVLKGNVPV